jgi:hypothetical protein
VGSNGHVVTAYHVVVNATTIELGGTRVTDVIVHKVIPTRDLDVP